MTGAGARAGGRGPAGRWTGRLPRRLSNPVVLGTVGLLALGSGAAVYASAGDGAEYRTAEASVSDVEQTLSLSGTVASADRAEVGFGTAGTVSSVKVAAGDSVRRGQVIAQLDRTDLEREVRRARSALADARAQLAAHEAGQSATVGEAVGGTQGGAPSGTQDDAGQGGVTTPSSTAGAASLGRSGGVVAAVARGAGAEVARVAGVAAPADGFGSEQVTKALAELARQQRAVTSAQSEVGAATEVADEALATQQAACEVAYDGGDGTEGSGSTPAQDAACDEALLAVQQAQAAVAEAQEGLSSALTALTDTLTDALERLKKAEQESAQDEGRGGKGQYGGAASPAPKTDQQQPQGRQPQGEQAQGQQPQGEQPGGTDRDEQSGPAGGSSTATAAQLAEDQAAIDAARADLVEARAALRGATLRAPWDGTVVAVSAAPGDDVAAGATAATLVAPGATVIEIDATLTQVRSLEVGQPAQVASSGAAEPLAASVSSVGTDPRTSTGTGSGTTYRVVLTLDDQDAALTSGTPASASVVVGTATDVLTVPTSAISDGRVRVLEDGEARWADVTAGVIGAARTEVREGLAEGAEVILADLSRSGLGDEVGGRPGGGPDGGGLGGFGGFGGGPPGGVSRR